MAEHARALIAEAAGTFMFLVIGAGAIVAQVVAGSASTGLFPVALAHGLALSVAVSAFGAISGGHFNPAVTFGLAVAGKHRWERLPTYWAAQLVGALAAGHSLKLLFDFAPAAADATHLGTPTVAAALGQGTAILVETILTVFLLWAVFGTAVAPSAPRIAGFGVGLAYAADMLVGGPLTGGAMNPARWFGPAVAAQFIASSWYVYWVGPLIGAGLAGLSYRYVFGAPGERERIELPRTGPAAASGAPAGPAERGEKLS
ncbi:MAG: aquaporin [Candidatus Limnocylindria bacterium]